MSAGHQFAVNRWNPGYTGGKERSGAQETAPAQSQGGAGAGSSVLFYLVFLTIGKISALGAFTDTLDNALNMSCIYTSYIYTFNMINMINNNASNILRYTTLVYVDSHFSHLVKSYDQVLSRN